MPTDNASSAPADLPAKGPLHGSALAVSVADLPGVVYRYRHDKDRTMLGLPETVQDLTGYTPEELIHNRQLRFAELIHPEDRERVRGEIREAIQSERPFRVLYRIRRRDGEERWVLEDGREADQGKGGETSDEQILVGYIQDVTVPPVSRLAKVQDEVETIRRQARRLKLLQEVTAIANRERRVEAAVGLALPKVCRAFGFSMGQVFLGGEGDLRKGNPPFEAARVWHVLEDHGEFSSLREGTGGCEWDIERGLPQRVLRAGSSEWVEDVGEDPGLLRSTPNGACPVVSGVGFPVMSGERSIGVVAIYSRKAVADDAEVRQLLEQIGLQLGRVWEREEGSRNLRVAEGWLRQLAHNVEAVLWLSNLEGEILYLSPGFEKLTGGRAPISHWRELMEIVHPEDRSRLENLFIQTDRVPYKIEYRILVDGEARWIRQKGFPVENHAGEVYRVGGLAEDVTAHRRTLQDLEEATRFLERTISSLAEGVLVIDTSGDGRKVLEVNRAVEEMFGYRREEIVGRTTEHLHVDRDSFLNFEKEGNPVLEEKGVFRTAYPMKRKDGTVFQAEQTVTLLDPIRGLTGGAVSVVRDISERETAISRLRESEERFRQIAEYIDDIFWIRSPEMDRVEYVSPAYQEIVGRPVEELYDDPSAWLSQVHPEDQERVLMRAERSAGGGFEEEYRIIREDGEVRWIWDRAFPVRNAKGEVYRLLGVAEDITERKELEGQLLQSQKMEAVGRLAGGVAHDFNNILTVVQASTNFLLMDLPQASDLNEEIQTIRESVERASRLTRQLLAFSREQVLRPQVLNVNEILGEMEKLLFRILGEDIRIETRLDPDLPPIRVDPGQVEQVIMNLVVNARDAMPEGGSLLLATAREDVDEQTAAIEPGLEPGPVVSITVSDTGQGIDADDLHRIFEPFFSTKIESGGTGLGLATSYGIVKQSGGNIHVESEPGVGTTFVIRFPLAEGPPREARSKAAENLKGEGVTGTVLIVEDDENVRRAIRRGLERAGFEVRTAGDAETAMGILDEDAVDLLVTDLVLPGMRGTELARRAKATHPGLGVVAMSGYAKGTLSGPESIPEEMAFIKKPFSPNALVERIREELNKEREE